MVNLYCLHYIDREQGNKNQEDNYDLRTERTYTVILGHYPLYLHMKEILKTTAKEEKQ